MFKYAITVVPDFGFDWGKRVLYTPNRIELFHDTEVQAQEKIKRIVANPKDCAMVFGENAVHTLQVRKTQCNQTQSIQTQW